MNWSKYSLDIKFKFDNCSKSLNHSGTFKNIGGKVNRSERLNDPRYLGVELAKHPRREDDFEDVAHRVSKCGQECKLILFA